MHRPLSHFISDELHDVKSKKLEIFTSSFNLHENVKLQPSPVLVLRDVSSDGKNLEECKIKCGSFRSSFSIGCFVPILFLSKRQVSKVANN